MLTDERLPGISCYLSATAKYRMMMYMLKRKKRQIPFGCFFWTAFIAVIAFLFFLNKDTIFSVWEKTNAQHIFVKDSDKVSHISAEILPEIPPQKESRAVIGDGSKPLYDGQEPESVLKEQHSDIPTELQKNSDDAKKHESTAVRKAIVYWIRIASDGKLIPIHADRLLPQSDSPMSDALQVLFAAPSVSELKDGVRTFIPPRTKLRSAWVKDGIAFINVSEEFQFNQYGIDGAVAQLMQVVFTATEFATVQSVQFLIEGQKQDYLGAEGAWIGSPLSRTSF